MKYWFRHLRWWVGEIFDVQYMMGHGWTKSLGDSTEWCMVCGLEREDPDFDPVEEAKLIKKYEPRED